MWIREWKTHYIAASNKDKITENGPFHIYVRHVEFHANDTVDVDFYVKSDGECVKKQVTGEKEKTLVYHITYAGQNKVKILRLSLDTIIGSIHNVDEDGKETELVGILETCKINLRPVKLSQCTLLMNSDMTPNDHTETLSTFPEIYTRCSSGFHTSQGLYVVIWGDISVHKNNAFEKLNRTKI
ncbi:hypothetical protein MJT46_019126 [Ovis ammon polii x Ovis aries]|nr:hypothetical protein MJT46_019126 [Ovis ammon polii x Ovis aries]